MDLTNKNDEPFMVFVSYLIVGKMDTLVRKQMRLSNLILLLTSETHSNRSKIATLNEVVVDLLVNQVHLRIVNMIPSDAMFLSVVYNTVKTLSISILGNKYTMY